VIAIFISLAALSLPYLDVAKGRENETRLHETLNDVRNAMDLYVKSRNNFAPKYPISIASLLSPIPTALLASGGDPGPFLYEIPRNPLASGSQSYFWDLRSASGGWILGVNDPNYIAASGIFDIRVPDIPPRQAIDQTRYSNW